MLERKNRKIEMKTKRTYELKKPSNKKGLIYDERGAAPCKFCKRKGHIVYPKIVEIEDLYYAQCSNPKCHRSDPYDYLGSTVKRTIENWNRTMKGKQNDLI